MRRQSFIAASAFASLLIILFSPVVVGPIMAQEDAPAPQFLYQAENRLVLVNGYTGETTELPIEVNNRDLFTWSPSGRYLLARLHEGENGFTSCLNLYDVDLQVWLKDEPIACAVEDALFSEDEATIIYSTSDGTNGILWSYNVADESHEELFRTSEGRANYPAGITELRWSPTSRYLTFVSYAWIMGGSLNWFVVMNTQSHGNFTLTVRDAYYASYDPIWSHDEKWFLITLQDQYMDGGVSTTNQEGDLYLVNSQTGEQYRLTYTPAVSEQGVRWTEDGNIAFMVQVEEDFAYTLDEARDIEVVPDDAIVWPDPVDLSEMISPPEGLRISPDPDLAAWVNTILGDNGTRTYELQIGDPSAKTRVGHVSIPMSNLYYPQSDLFIGWRPSN